MSRPPVRTLTLGLAEPHPISSVALERAAQKLQAWRQAFVDSGWEVQTVRVATRSLFDDFSDRPDRDLLDYSGSLEKMLAAVGLEFCSIGTAPACRSAFPVKRINPIADLLIASDRINASVQLVMRGSPVRTEAAPAVASVIKRLATETPEGFGNFRFAALACVPPGSPFFPAAYHEGPESLSIAMQGASIVSDALMGEALDDLATISERVRSTLSAVIRPVVDLGERLARQAGIRFSGIDLSPAPMGEDSIVSAMESIVPFGSPGTLALAAAITEGIRAINLPSCGYGGLMLPVLEDATLGARWAEGKVDVHKLLAYSAVCGTGLDAVPLPGDTSEEEISALLIDVASLAMRLDKPLSARLFPVAGKKAGERTTFSSAYLTNTILQ